MSHEGLWHLCTELFRHFGESHRTGSSSGRLSGVGWWEVWMIYKNPRIQVGPPLKKTNTNIMTMENPP